MQFRGKRWDLLKGRAPFYEMTEEIDKRQRALIDAEYSTCLRLAFTTSSDPRVDLVDIVENSYARLRDDWVRREDKPKYWLCELVQAYAEEACKELRDRWTGPYWPTNRDYVELFEDVAGVEVLPALPVVTHLPDQMKRVFEGRRIYDFPVQLTANRLQISPNSVGSCTTRAESRIKEVADLTIVLEFFAKQMGGGG